MSTLSWLREGIVWIAAHAGGSTTVKGLAMTLLAAICWASGNTLSRRAGRVNMPAYVVWSSLFAFPPLLGLTLLVEGWPAVTIGILRASASTWLAVQWQSAGNTLFGYVAWGWLLARYPAAAVTHMALLVPVFGMRASAPALNEALLGWKLQAAALVTAGLALNILWPRWQAWRRARLDSSPG